MIIILLPFDILSVFASFFGRVKKRWEIKLRGIICSGEYVGGICLILFLLSSAVVSDLFSPLTIKATPSFSDR